MTSPSLAGAFRFRPARPLRTQLAIARPRPERLPWYRRPALFLAAGAGLMLAASFSALADATNPATPHPGQQLL